MLPILERIKSECGNFRWFIAGDGPLYKTATDECERLNLTENVVFLGLLSNPYPYFKNADVMLLPSYNEAAPMVYGEAIFFKTPVFTTNTTSAEEIIGKNFGWVVENSDEEIYKKLRAIILGEEPLKSFDISFNNDKAKEEFEEMLK